MYTVKVVKIFPLSKIGRVASLFVFAFLLCSFSGNVQAQDNSPQCTPSTLAEYMNTVIAEAGNLQYVRLLSPAFNMTNNNSVAIANEMLADGANFGALDGLAGNAYNCCGNTVTGHIQNFRDGTGLSLPILITETGKIDGTYDALGNEMDIIKSGSNYLGALLFNAFNTNGSWEQFRLDTDLDGNGVTDLDQVCKGNCSNLGANSATFYPESPGFYSTTAGAGMTYTLSISNADPSTTDGVMLALQNGLTPVIRVGTAFAAGPNATGYGEYLKGLDATIASSSNPGVVYAIAGPNEPQSETWVTDPDCEGDDVDIPINIRGKVRTYTQSRSADHKTLSGQPIRGATLAFFEGTWDTDSGNRHGNISLYDHPDAIVTTDSEGNYSLRGRRKANGGSFNNSGYVLIWCGNDMYKDYVDGWSFDLSETDIEWDFSVPCAQTDYPTPAEPLPEFNLSILGEPLACGVEQPVNPQTYTAAKIVPGGNAGGDPRGIKLEFKDDDTYYGNVIGPNGQGLPPSPQEPTTKGLPGRAGPETIIANSSNTDVISFAAGRYTFGEADSLKEGELPEQTLPLCTEILRCNQSIAYDNDPENRNDLTCYSMVSRLATPGMWEDLYARALSIDDDVCIHTDGSVVKLSDIEPPTASLKAMNDKDSYKLPQSLGNYFPYAALYGARDAGAKSQANFDKPTNDSFEDFGPYTDTSRELALAPDKEEKSMVVWNTIEQPAGRVERSIDAAANIANPTYAQENIGYDKPPAAIFSQPYAPFGQGSDNVINPDITRYGNENIRKVGVGDYQIGRPNQLCYSNTKDTALEAPYRTFNSYNETHAWDGGYKFTPNCDSVICTIEAAFLEFFGFFLGETINDETYEIVDTPVYVAWPGPTQQDFNPATDLDGECVEWRPVGNCDPSSPTCEIGGCTYDDGTPCDHSLCTLPSPPPNVTCTFSQPVYACYGAITAYYQGESESFEYPSCDKAQAAAALELALPFYHPYKEIRQVGSATFQNEGITNQADDDLETRAYITGCAGGFEGMITNTLRSVSDPSTKPYQSAPAFSGKMSNSAGSTDGPPDTNTCNEFNCGGGGPLATTSSCGAGALGAGLLEANNATWRAVDRYGFWCQVEATGHPFAHNLMNFIDTYAPSGYGRTCGAVPKNTTIPLPPKYVCDDHDWPDSARKPGDPNFDYYREEIVDCPLINPKWSGTVESHYNDICTSGRNINYLGVHLNSAYNCDGGVAQSRVTTVLNAAKQHGVNPWLVLGVWATESAWGQIQSCLPPDPGTVTT